MTEPRHTDDLAQRYIEASAQDPRRPPTRVRDAARAHALDVIASKTAPAPVNKPATNKQATDRPAANQTRWKISLLASIALAGITGLLVLQFDRGTAEEKELALGQAMPRRESAAPAAPAAPANTAVVAPASPAESPPAAPPPQAKLSLNQASAKASPPEARVNAAPKPAAPATPAPVLTSAPAPASASAPPQVTADSNLAKATPPAAQPEPPVPAPTIFTTPLMLPRPAPQAPAKLADAAPAAESSGVATGANSGLSTGAIAPQPIAAAPVMPAAPAALAAAPAPAAAPTGAARAKASQSQDLKQAMIEAARVGNTAQIESLPQQGAPLNAVDETGRTALIWAVINNQTSTVQKLLALGANKAIRDSEGLTALQHARRLNLDRMAALLEAGP